MVRNARSKGVNRGHSKKINCYFNDENNTEILNKSKNNDVSSLRHKDKLTLHDVIQTIDRKDNNKKNKRKLSTININDSLRSPEVMTESDSKTTSRSSAGNENIKMSEITLKNLLKRYYKEVKNGLDNAKRKNQRKINEKKEMKEARSKSPNVYVCEVDSDEINNNVVKIKPENIKPIKLKRPKRNTIKKSKPSINESSTEDSLIKCCWDILRTKLEKKNKKQTSPATKVVVGYSTPRYQLTRQNPKALQDSTTTDNKIKINNSKIYHLLKRCYRDGKCKPDKKIINKLKGELSPEPFDTNDSVLKCCWNNIRKKCSNNLSRSAVMSPLSRSRKSRLKKPNNKERRNKVFTNFFKIYDKKSINDSQENFTSMIETRSNKKRKTISDDMLRGRKIRIKPKNNDLSKNVLGYSSGRMDNYINRTLNGRNRTEKNKLAMGDSLESRIYGIETAALSKSKEAVLKECKEEKTKKWPFTSKSKSKSKKLVSSEKETNLQPYINTKKNKGKRRKKSEKRYNTSDNPKITTVVSDHKNIGKENYQNRNNTKNTVLIYNPKKKCLETVQTNDYTKNVNLMSNKKANVKAKDYNPNKTRHSAVISKQKKKVKETRRNPRKQKEISQKNMNEITLVVPVNLFNSRKKRHGKPSSIRLNLSKLAERDCFIVRNENNPSEKCEYLNTDYSQTSITSKGKHPIEPWRNQAAVKQDCVCPTNETEQSQFVCRDKTCYSPDEKEQIFKPAFKMRIDADTMRIMNSENVQHNITKYLTQVCDAGTCYSAARRNDKNFRCKCVNRKLISLLRRTTPAKRKRAGIKLTFGKHSTKYKKENNLGYMQKEEFLLDAIKEENKKILTQDKITSTSDKRLVSKSSTILSTRESKTRLFTSEEKSKLSKRALRKAERKAKKKKLKEKSHLRRVKTDAEMDAKTRNYCSLVLKSTIQTMKGIVNSIRRPKKTYKTVVASVKDPSLTTAKAPFVRWVTITKTKARSRKKQVAKYAENSRISVVNDQLQNSSAYKLFENRGNTRKERAEVKRRRRRRQQRIRHRRNVTLARCNYLNTLRYTPCLWLYQIFPRCYPHCLSIAMALKDVFRLFLIALAYISWCPLVLCFELAAVFICCHP